MIKRTLIVAGVALLLGTALFVLRVPHTLAHEGREVGEYELHFGWQVEPAYVGVYNGPEIFIHMPSESEADEVPVEGAE
jgi:hypothetical protein